MMETLIDIDRDLFIALNGFHSESLDPIVYFLTNTSAWIPLYVVLLYLIFKTYGKASWIYLVGIAFTILLADQVTSSVMKPAFERLRPTHDPAIKDVVHTVKNYKGGKFGFASSHAANTFGCAMFIYLMLRKNYTWSSLLFAWAAFVSYTRIYLGVHYPGDIIAGAVVGIFFAGIAFLLCQKGEQRMYHFRADNSL